jgi:hypothetical protein
MSKILILAANPMGTARIAFDEEIRAIDDKIRAAEYREQLELVLHLAVRLDDLSGLLLRHQPDIVHFSGHGAGSAASHQARDGAVADRDLIPEGRDRDGSIVLVGADGTPEPVPSEALGGLFGARKDNVRLVVLNACYSESQAEVIVKHIDCAIGMSAPVGDTAAIGFAAEFYQALAYGQSVQAAYELGVVRLMRKGVADVLGLARLHTREGIDASKIAFVKTAPRIPAGPNDNRSLMLEKMRKNWIDGYLEKSLHHKTRILLGLSGRPDAVLRPMDLRFHRPDRGEQPLPPGTQIVNAFDSMDRALLILGGPGSGKTTLLLELLRDLLDRAERNVNEPIPVIFNLSSWAVKRLPLKEWLIDELNRFHKVPLELARPWVEANQVLPLLDGLDEVKPEHRTECVLAINAFRQSRGFLPLAICSRSADYQALASPLQLQGAIVVQPLTRPQVESYLTEIGTTGAAVREAIRQEPALWDLLDTPLMLDIISVAYAGGRDAKLESSRTLEGRRNLLFAAYVDEMFERRDEYVPYSQQQTVHWLTWLAGQMVRRSQTVFSLEGLQPDWVPDRQRRAFGLMYRLSVGLVFGLVAGLIDGLLVALAVGLSGEPGGRSVVGRIGGLPLPLSEGLGFGLVVGVAGAVLRGTSGKIICAETVKWSWWNLSRRDLAAGLVRRVRAGMAFGMALGMVSGMAVGLFYALSVPWTVVHHSGAHFGLILGLKIAQFVGLAGGLLGVVSGLVAGWRFGPRAGLGTGLKVGLAGGLAGGPVAGLVVGLAVGLVGGKAGGLVFGFVFWLALGLIGGASGSLMFGVAGAVICGLVGGLVGGLYLLLESGLSVGYIETRDTPNQGIRRSARNALVLGTIAGLVAGLGVALVLGLATGLAAGRGFELATAQGGLGLIIGLVVGLFGALQAGGQACLEHFLLRLLLVRNDSAPWNYVRFLDHAAERILLRKVGGGYIFIHRMLMEYFAAGPDAAPAAKPPGARPSPSEQNAPASP